MIAAACFALLIALIGVGVPVGFSLAIAGSVGLLATGGPTLLLGILDTVGLSTVSSYEMISVPMFLLMAEFVVLSGVADDLFDAAAAWVGRIRGGLGIATALAGAGFGAISGSSTAAAATLSSTTIPAMLRQGYEKRLACGVVAISGTLAMLIPPSIALVLYGIIGDVSVGRLLIGGVVPGLLVTLTIAATVYLLVLVHPSRAPRGRAVPLREKVASLRVVGPMLLLFAAVTGVIYTGIATPTEASAIGAAGALALAMREGKVDRRALLACLGAAASVSCMIFMIILGARIFTFFVTLTQVTQSLVAWTGGLALPPHAILAGILFGYLVLGCFMDQAAILILTVPIVLPVVKALGFDPVWFGVLVIVVGEVGLLTPPVGLNVFVVSRYTGIPTQDVFAGVWPHVFAHLVLIVLLVAFPALILWLPENVR